MKKRIIASLILAPLMLLALNPNWKDVAKPLDATYIPYQIPNGGFENGDLSGWTRFGIWKVNSEPGLIAFNPERVVSIANYGSSTNYPYNRDGNYHLGVYAYPYSSDNKNLNQERMGHLKSSTFVLGGSGWISFKLGGGKNTSTAYMSIHRADTHIEVARFGNRHFGNTTLSGTANAEAYMFPYYFDLSAQLGQQLYIKLTEAASFEWCVLSADSIVTYYSTAPTISGNPPSGDYLASDIKPSIYGVGSSTNAISNELTANVTNWENPNSVFRWDSAARTNAVTGDGDLGSARSPAFNTNGVNTHLIWEWEGNISKDKQLFVSVKEVGTNIEVKRLVRRDNLSGKTGGGFDNHWTSLTSLSTSKEYYVELVDNLTGSYGLISVKSVRLRQSSDSKVVSGDEAVSITPLTTNFTLTIAEEAKSYGAYFIETTASYCQALNGGNVPWLTLKSGYNSLTNDAKDYFVNVATSDTEIVAARDRYVYLFQKYGELQTWDNFMVSSSNNPYYTPPEEAFGQHETLIFNSETTYFILIIATTFVFAAAGYFFIKKKAH